MDSSPTDAQLAAALQATGYEYTDPTHDAKWPRISAHDDSAPCADDLFPPGWGAEPTERDQAAIDAGNA